MSDKKENQVRMMRKEELWKLSPLFRGWEKVMVDACLQGMMGEVYVTEEGDCSSGAALVGDFCFLSGKPDERLTAYGYGREFLIMAPSDEGWSGLIEKTFSSAAHRRMRYAFKKEEGCFDRGRLKEAAAALPKEFVLAPIDGHLYKRCLEQGWSRDLVSNFPTPESYEKQGLGFVILKEDTIISGASSYSRSRDGIEIEIDTREDCRRMGLAFVCGAALILRCLEQGLYPGWDAQNPSSRALAEKLGYHFSHEYPVYEIGSFRDPSGGAYL